MARGILLFASHSLGLQRPAEPVALPQPPPVGSDRGAEIPAQADAIGQQQRIADGNVGHREPAGAQRLTPGHRRFDRPEPAEEPFA